MKNTTKALYHDYLHQISQLNRVVETTSTFTVDPSVQQTLESKMQESSEFLTKINVLGVDQQEGEKVGLGISGTIAGRTDTSTGTERKPASVADVSSNRYRCEQTNFDTFIAYSTLDAWAKFPDFQARLAMSIVRRQALDRIAIGFNGTRAEKTTDRGANPLLQDVNIGWIQQFKNNAPQRVMTEHKTPGKLIVGTSDQADYKNLDALVYDALTLLDPWYRANPGLVVMASRALIHDKYFPLVNSDQRPTDQLATDTIMTQRRIGSLPAYEVPYLPAGKLVITAFENLSLYYQTESRRRFLIDQPQFNRIANFESSNDAYVVEDYGFGAVVENITIEHK